MVACEEGCEYMCGRFAAMTEEEINEVRSVVERLSIRLSGDNIDDVPTAAAEIRPTDSTPVMTANNDKVFFEKAVFGFKKWGNKGVIINARAETVSEKKMFSDPGKVGRCVIPAGEYYEWKDMSVSGSDTYKSKKAAKVKYSIKDVDGNILFFAGLYRDGDKGREFVIITKDATEEIKAVHDRMPVVLNSNQIEKWLDGALSPDDLVSQDFRVSVVPYDNETRGTKPPGNFEQLSFL